MARKRCEKRLQMDTYMLDQYDEIAAALGDAPMYRQPKGISKRYEKRQQVHSGPKRKHNAPSYIDNKKKHEYKTGDRLITQILSSREDVLKTVTPDKFVGTPAVVGLTNETFKNYLRDYAAAMVLFYAKEIPLCTKVLPAVRESAWFRGKFYGVMFFLLFVDYVSYKRIVQYSGHFTNLWLEVIHVYEFLTARTLEKPSHTFAAVDCTDQIELCISEEIKNMPSFKLYSLGKFVGQFDDNMNAAEMKRVFNRAPPTVRSDWELRPACEERINDAGNTSQDIDESDYSMSDDRSPTDDNAMYSMNWL